MLDLTDSPLASPTNTGLARAAVRARARYIHLAANRTKA
jgi:hypothetical protein